MAIYSNLFIDNTTQHFEFNAMLSNLTRSVATFIINKTVPGNTNLQLVDDLVNDLEADQGYLDSLVNLMYGEADSDPEDNSDKVYPVSTSWTDSGLLLR